MSQTCTIGELVDRINGSASAILARVSNEGVTQDNGVDLLNLAKAMRSDNDELGARISESLNADIDRARASSAAPLKLAGETGGVA